MEQGSVRFLCKIDRKLYACVSENIVSEDVVLNPERILHIQEHHPGDYERYGKYMRSMIEEPDYIVETDRPKTAFMCGQKNIGGFCGAKSALQAPGLVI